MKQKVLFIGKPILHRFKLHQFVQLTKYVHSLSYTCIADAELQRYSIYVPLYIYHQCLLTRFPELTHGI